jgi:cytochrome d ubiquinol oxidase subunit II
MFSFEGFLDLPLIWYSLIGTAILMYVLLDGFDLGVGILFPFAPTEDCRNRMMNSIAPFWDGNETWLVLGGGGLFAAFPLAYAVLMPAFYIPIILMLLGLIFRGVAFEFRFKATGKSRRIWDYSFHFGSLLATFMQGVQLGTFVNGIAVEGRSFAGGPFDWLNAFSVMTGVALVTGYALLGATWTIMKTEGETQEWARKSAKYVMIYVALFMGLVSLIMPMINSGIKELWFSLPNFYFLQPMPILSVVFFVMLWRDLRTDRQFRPFLLTLGIFLMNYIGIGISTWPFLVPFRLTLWEVAATPESQSLLLVGTAFLLPCVLAYTGYCFWVFRGKASHEHDAAY